MPMQNPEGNRTTAALAALARRAGPDADAAQIAVAMAAIWREISAALTPIIGNRGAAALYQRSVHLSTALHPWLSVLMNSNAATLDASELEPLLAQQTRAEAMVGGSDLLQTFQQLLASLIGASLTERLLRSVWNPL